MAVRYHTSSQTKVWNSHICSLLENGRGLYIFDTVCKDGYHIALIVKEEQLSVHVAQNDG